MKKLDPTMAPQVARAISVFQEQRTGYQCPVCRNPLPHLEPLPAFNASCCNCGSYLWCLLRDFGKSIVLEAVAGRAPEPSEVKRVVVSLGWYGTLDCVTVDLSKLEIMDSSFLAALVQMRKQLLVSDCTLFLCGLRPIVRDIFDRLRFGQLFNVVECDEHVAVVP